MTDDQLYQSYLAGDASAGDQLMLRCGDALTAYLAAFLHSEEDAEDLMLDCFTVILVDKPKIREGHFRPYLFRVARNKANRLWKLRIRRNEFSLDENPIFDSGRVDASPEEELWKNERNAILRRCLNRIAPQYREALWLIYDMDMSYAQAAEVLSCGTKKVEDLLRNGKKRLHSELEKEGISYADI